MNTPNPASSQASFITRLRNAGIEPGDSEELQLNKQLLMFATGLVSAASMVWLTIYWFLGPQFPVNFPYLFLLAMTANVLIYIQTRNFNLFRVAQLSLFLFAPFAMQWGVGNFLDASGIVLWGLLAPVGAILFFGVRESLAWFFAWAFLIVLSGVFDYLLADPSLKPAVQIPCAPASSSSR